MKKLHMGQLDLNTKKSLSGILEFSILIGTKKENAEFRKTWIFKHKSALKLLHGEEMSYKTIDWNTKKQFWGIFLIFDFKEGNC